MTTVIYHSADFDGIFCREIAKLFIPDATLIGWNFGDKPLEIPTSKLYVLDLPVDAVFGFDYKVVGNQRGPQHPAGLIWIDHHKSSIESHPTDIAGYRIDGVAACRLAWQWFKAELDESTLPVIDDYINRNVQEPYSVRLAGEYDIWDKRDSNPDVFQFGLRARELTNEDWADLLLYDSSVVEKLLDDGIAIQKYQRITDASVMKKSFLVKWEGLTFLTLNTARCNSLTFAAKDTPETGHDALLGFCHNGKQWTVSMYHSNDRKDIDLSQIATKHGGGGHRGACGFTAKELPFNLIQL